jgi:CheY-like chemotaxis protein
LVTLSFPDLALYGTIVSRWDISENDRAWFRRCCQATPCWGPCRIARTDNRRQLASLGWVERRSLISHPILSGPPPGEVKGSAKFTFAHWSGTKSRLPRDVWELLVGERTALEDLPVILVVEDDQSLQNIVEIALSDGGFEPAIAASGEEAVTLLQGGLTKYRALVTDINLRGSMDGWEVAKRAREIDPQFPIVYMTGASADEYGSHGVPNSILLTKPFAPAQLVTAVSQLLNTGTPTT